MKHYSLTPMLIVALPLLLAGLSLAELPRQTADTIVGRVVSVTDGDTLKVLDADKTQHTVRLAGIDAPERGQAFGTRAKQALSSKVFNTTVNVEWHERDRYDRVLGNVYRDDRLINLELVQEGWAWHYKQYDSNQGLADAENAARAKRAGLWVDAQPSPPWDFRRGQSESKQTVAAQPAESESRQTTVYVTRTGHKYHSGGCRYLSKSKIPMRLDSAKKAYGPCSVCHPPR